MYVRDNRLGEDKSPLRDFILTRCWSTRRRRGCARGVAIAVAASAAARGVVAEIGLAPRTLDRGLDGFARTNFNAGLMAADVAAATDRTEPKVRTRIFPT